MKITYAPNPLDTIVELGEQETEILRLKIKIEQYEDRMYGAYFHLADTKFLDVAKAAKKLDPDYWCNDEPGSQDHSRLDTRVDTLLGHYIEELRSSHAGDCTAFAASCSKCQAEDMLGISTIKPYPGKSVMHQLYHTFNYRDGDTWKTRSLDEALTKLDGAAYDYLINYRNTNLGE